MIPEDMEPRNPIRTVRVDKSSLPALFAAKQEKLIDEVDNFKYAAEAGTLGDYAEKGFLMHLMLILMED